MCPLRDKGVPRLPTIEYYDRRMPKKRLLPACRQMQDEYWLLRSSLCVTIAANWPAILESCPEVASAATALEVFLHSHPTRTFLVFRPEDLAVKQEAGSPVFLR